MAFSGSGSYFTAPLVDADANPMCSSLYLPHSTIFLHRHCVSRVRCFLTAACACVHAGTKSIAQHPAWPALQEYRLARKGVQQPITAIWEGNML
jgi:hypothetical protein